MSCLRKLVDVLVVGQHETLLLRKGESQKAAVSSISGTVTRIEKILNLSRLLWKNDLNIRTRDIEVILYL